MSHDKAPARKVSDKNAHAFPCLIKDAVDKDTNPNGTNHKFTPMFNEGVSTGVQNQSALAEAHQHGQDDPLETASQHGFEMGYAAGREDACGLVQNELAPIINDLQKALKSYASSGKEIAEIYSINCLKLALAIVEKIAGETPLLTLEDLSAAKTIINQALNMSFGLNLRFNPDDYQCIETVSACNDIDWKRYLQSGINSDDSIDSGAVHSFSEPVDWDNIQEQMEIVLDTAMAPHGHNLPQE